jgi:uncharacterized protein DUF3999
MMARLVSCTLLGAALALHAVALAQERVEPSFRFERNVQAVPGAQRLAVDVPLLVGSQPFTVSTAAAGTYEERRRFAAGGLGDLRLFDASGREVPYLLVPPPALPEIWVSGRVLPIAATKKTSGFEADFDQPTALDRIRIDGLRPPFLKRVTIEGSGDRSRWTVLVAQGTLFDLPDQRLQQLDFALPPGTYQYIRATWDDTNSALVAAPSAVRARVVVAQAPRAVPLTLTLPAERISSEPGRSRYRIRLPGARLPIVGIEPQLDAPYVLRPASISESRLADARLVPTTLGRGTLRRVARDDLTASSTVVPINSPIEPELDLIIEDGDNPPLALTKVVASFAELPWIYFESEGGTVVARWGDRRLSAPAYDLEAARPSIGIGALPDATWGEVRSLTPATAPSGTTPIPNTGAPLDVDRFRYSRPIPAGDPGLIAVPLDAAVLAHSTGIRTGFADVRIADAAGRQVPYILESRDEPMILDLALEKRDPPRSRASASRSPATSYYRVRLPYAGLPSWRLALTTTASVFDRRVTLAAERPADPQHRDEWLDVLTAGRWVHADRDRPAPALMLNVLRSEGTDVLLIVDEGDNSALPIASSRLLLPSFRVRLFREAGTSLRLLYGRDDLGPPSYDLALLAASVLGVAAREVAAAPEQSAESATMAIASPRVFWSVLIVAVVILLIVLGRLIRRDAGTPPA